MLSQPSRVGGGPRGGRGGCGLDRTIRWHRRMCSLPFRGRGVGGRRV